jgi:hypothetical protein
MQGERADSNHMRAAAQATKMAKGIAIKRKGRKVVGADIDAVKCSLPAGFSSRFA